MLCYICILHSLTTTSTEERLMYVAATEELEMKYRWLQPRKLSSCKKDTAE